MAIFREQLPSKNELFHVFAVCAFPIYSWSILAFFQKVPSWLLFMSQGEILGAFAYAQLFALVESLLFVALFIILTAVMPKRWFKSRFVAHSSAIMLASVGLAMALQSKSSDLRSLNLSTFGLWGLLYVLVLGFSYFLIARFAQVKKALDALAERLTILLYLYLPVTALSVTVILIRNLGS